MSSCYCGVICRCICCPSPHKEPVDNTPMSVRKRCIYVLLLGAAETGKSTLMRQMKIIHDGEMSVSNLRNYVCPVLVSVLNSVTALAQAMQSDDQTCKSEKAIEAAKSIIAFTPAMWGLDGDRESNPKIPEEHAEFIRIFWSDEGAKNCWRLFSHNFSLPDSTEYYLDAIDRIAIDDFIPSQEDVLRMRLPTNEIAEYDFLDRNVIFRITDVGGQRGERRRWLRLFSSTHAIIFLAGLSEYDATYGPDENNMNRLELSLQLFKETIRFPGFVQTTLILFLNKQDIFKQKIQHSHLGHYFPDYTGPENDEKAASSFIKHLFSSAGDEENRDVYYHETCATDTQAIKVIFAAVRDSIFRDILEIYVF